MIALLPLSRGAVEPGENLVCNGCFQELDAEGKPMYWAKRGVGCNEAIHFFPDGGPDGLPFIRIGNPKGGVASGEPSFRQQGLVLKEGETYKFSAMVRTHGFRCRHYGIGIINFDWYQDLGIDTLPENQDWTRVERTVTMIPSNSRTYAALLFALDAEGTLDVTDFRIEAVSEGALTASEQTAIVLNQRKPRLVPFSPRLYRIPAADPAVTFRFFGELPKGTAMADYDIVLETAGCGPSRKKLSSEEIRMPLPSGASAGDLHVGLVNRETGDRVFSSYFEFAVVEPPEIDTKGHRPLNNLVTEILNEEIAPGLSEQVFYAPRNGWIFAAVEGPAAETRVVLDGGLEIIDPATPRRETFRKVSAGRHVLAISQAASGGRIVVRAIPEIFCYCPGLNSFVTENPPYGWEFIRKYELPAVTTLDGGVIEDEHIDEFHRLGYTWVGNMRSRALDCVTDLATRLEKSPFIKSGKYDGVACDEQVFLEQDIIERYAIGLTLFRNHGNKMLYSWNGGGIPSTPVDASFVAACINASRGDGLMLHEYYSTTMPSREEAEQRLRADMAKLIGGYRTFYPGSEASLGVILGVFMQMPILSIHSHPEVDFKAHLDLQCQILATDPVAASIACVGGWGTYYADEEHHRWFYRLMRHYFVEGRTDSLAEAYGFNYLPAHLENGDFHAGLDGWAVDGAVAVDRFPGFGIANLGMLGVPNEALDNAAVFHKEGGRTSAISRSVRNLEPGRRYCLQFVTMDADDVRARRNNPRLYAIAARLPAELKVVRELSWIHNDQREVGHYSSSCDAAGHAARINLHHIVFEATVAEAAIVFDNAGAQDGENLGLACISLNPYYSAE